MGRIPPGVKIAYTVWLLIWIPCYWNWYGPSIFLWFCDIGNFVLCLALWRESRLLFSWQAVSLLLVQFYWLASFLSGIPTGEPLLGGADYMFNEATPLGIRFLTIKLHQFLVRDQRLVVARVFVQPLHYNADLNEAP